LPWKLSDWTSEEGSGNEAAEQAEITADASSAQVNAGDTVYNAYTEAGGLMQRKRNSLSAEL